MINKQLIGTIDAMFDMPDELNTPKSVLLLDPKLREKFLTKPRLEIIKFLREQNPVTKEDIINLFGKNSVNDLNILNHMNLINLERQDKKRTIITLNRDIVIFPKI